MFILHANLKKVNTPPCETLFYIGLGEEAECGRPSAYTINTGTLFQYPLCEDCAAACPPSRLVKIKSPVSAGPFPNP
jgi:hypothetical protein